MESGWVSAPWRAELTAETKQSRAGIVCQVPGLFSRSEMRAAAFESICVCDRRQGGAGGSLAQLNEVIDYYESLIENVDVMSCGRFATETLFCLCQCIVPQLGKICVRSCRIWDITSHSKSEPRTPLCTQIHHQAELEQVKAFKFTFWSIINSLIDPLIKIRVLLWTFACCSCCFEIKSS